MSDADSGPQAWQSALNGHTDLSKNDVDEVTLSAVDPLTANWELVEEKPCPAVAAPKLQKCSKKCSCNVLFECGACEAAPSCLRCQICEKYLGITTDLLAGSGHIIIKRVKLLLEWERCNNGPNVEKYSALVEKLKSDLDDIREREATAPRGPVDIRTVEPTPITWALESYCPPHQTSFGAGHSCVNCKDAGDWCGNKDCLMRDDKARL